MMQSRVKIEGYSVAYFERINAFEAPCHSGKGGAHMHFVDSLDIHASKNQRKTPVLSGSSAIRRFKHSNAIKICNKIVFDFYMGLPHIVRQLHSPKSFIV